MTISVTHSTAADDTFSAEGALALNAAHTVTGLGTIATQNADNVAITGGSISGVNNINASLIAGYSVVLSGTPADHNALMFSSALNAWTDVPQTEITDGGNF